MKSDRNILSSQIKEMSVLVNESSFRAVKLHLKWLVGKLG